MGERVLKSKGNVLSNELQDKLKFVENVLSESRYFSKMVRKYLYEVEQIRELTEDEKMLWNKTHDVHIHANDAELLIQEMLK